MRPVLAARPAGPIATARAAAVARLGLRHAPPASFTCLLPPRRPGPCSGGPPAPTLPPPATGRPSNRTFVRPIQ